MMDIGGMMINKYTTTDRVGRMKPRQTSGVMLENKESIGIHTRTLMWSQVQVATEREGCNRGWSNGYLTYNPQHQYYYPNWSEDHSGYNEDSDVIPSPSCVEGFGRLTQECWNQAQTKHEKVRPSPTPKRVQIIQILDEFFKGPDWFNHANFKDFYLFY